ncbi:polysaccharide biosynthesis protein [Asticcacaulis sp. AC460]|uniref:lipopolysaccharide biosynthesis protein n=1 Tax=Asticcacaulis sp. AC460 TaxID=1282360 RepID=UPI0003C3AF35|nr:lipopolysaccharide biosynthesis protein [Asticcacaulis sp. AC460]ESQ89138.1 polysaccharide biosynthesis protein [Asticcacaulis sp. AC460]
MYVKGLLGYLPANILQGLVGFASLTVFTRLLSPEDYGHYAMALGVTTLAQTMFFTWIEAAMARFYPAESRDDAQAPALYGTLYRLVIAVFIGFAALSALGLWLWPGSGPFKMAVGISLGCVIFRTLVKMVQEQRKSEGRVGAASMIDMVQTAGGFGLGALCAWAGLGGAAPILGGGVIALATLPFIVREDWGRAAKGSFDRGRAKAYLQYGLPVSASLILTLGLYTVDRFLIAHYLNAAEAGAYHAGFSLASRILDVLFIWFGAAGGPAMVHALESGGVSGLRENARQQLRIMSFVLFPAVAGLIMVAPELGGLLIGEGLRTEALSVTPLIAIGAVLSGLNTYYFLQAFTLAKKTKLLVIAMAVPAVSNIVLNVILIQTMGLIGAAWASLLSFALGIAASWLLGLKTLPLPIPVLDLIKTAACAGAMMAVLSVLPRWGIDVVDLAIRSVTGVVIYGALAWLLNLNSIRDIVHQRLMKRAAA